MYMGGFLLSAYLEALTCVEKWWRFEWLTVLKVDVKAFPAFHDIISCWVSVVHIALDLEVVAFQRFLVFDSLLDVDHHFRVWHLYQKRSWGSLDNTSNFLLLQLSDVQWVPSQRQWLSCPKPKGPQTLYRKLVTVEDSPEFIKGSSEYP